MGILIIAAWPQTAVRPTGCWYDRVFALLGRKLPTGRYRLGHAGCLLICETTGQARYFDCGRYQCPPRMCRIRDAIHDPEVTIAARGRFAADGSLSNCDQLLIELAANSATHGEGVMVAAVIGGLDFDAACREAAHLQTRSYPFRLLGAGSLNCTRFLLRITPFARSSWAMRALAAAAPLAAPGTLLLTCIAASTGPISIVEQGQLTRCRRWAPFFRRHVPLLPSPAEQHCDGQMAPQMPRRRPGVPAGAKWLSGTAVGKWIALTRERELGRREYRFRRWSDSGQQDCDRVFELAEGDRFDPERPFEVGYPTDCRQCTVHQAGRTCYLTFSRDL